MALPELPEETFIEAIDLLLQHDHEWVPSAPDHSLYLRPFMFASDVGLGVHLGGEVTFLLIASPSGSYFTSGVKPVTVWLPKRSTRAPRRAAPVRRRPGGNYAGGLIAQAQAAREGCDDVVWLDAAEHKWVEEMGGMNLAFVFGKGGRPTARHITADRHVAAGRHARFAAEARGATSATGPRSAASASRNGAQGCADGSISRSVRVRHGRGDHADRRGEVGARRLEDRRRRGGPDDSMKLREALVDIQRGVGA